MDTINFRLSALSKFCNESSPAVADIYVNGQPLFENFLVEHASISVAELHENAIL